MNFEDDSDHDNLEMSEFIRVCCNTCGIHFYLPQAFADEKKKAKKVFRCPSGHAIMFKIETQPPAHAMSEAAAKKLRKQKKVILKQQAQIDQLSAEINQLKGLKTDDPPISQLDNPEPRL